MGRNVWVISLLVAALGSGLALAKGNSGGGSSGSATGGSSSSMQKSKQGMGDPQMESVKGSQKAKDEAALKEQERERERLQLQQKDASGQAGSDPLQTRAQDRIQQQDQVKP